MKDDIITLLNFLIDKRILIHTADFEYDPDWLSKVPEGWDLEKYFNVMGELQSIFERLYLFHNVSHFPTFRLYFFYKNDIIEITLIEGQGSEFMLEITEDKDLPYVFEFEDMYRMGTDPELKAYDFAKFFFEKIKKYDATYKDYFNLGQHSICKTFFETPFEQIVE